MNLSAEDMKVGDYVEFLSDQQTEKGPSAGRVIGRGVHRTRGITVAIRHSDHPAESFFADELRIERLTEHHKGGRLWMLA